MCSEVPCKKCGIAYDIPFICRCAKCVDVQNSYLCRIRSCPSVVSQADTFGGAESAGCERCRLEAADVANLALERAETVGSGAFFAVSARSSVQIPQAELSVKKERK